MAKAKFPIMTLTQAAADRVRTLMADRAIAGLRVGVKNGGCAGMSYTLDYAEAIGPYDEVVEDRGVKIIVDPKALMFLFGTEMDFRTDKIGSGFTFNNPNQTGACGCGESIAITPASEAQIAEARRANDS
ncbi:MAG: iron-sulfur cluster assembly accessory protein [Methylovirgula sp.]|nr:iron-sulfur cluster assembly accessory protein [Methylovirgula sp.]